MLPYILAAVGGYLIGDSMKGKQYAEVMADGGEIFVGRFDENQLRKKEDKSAIEKAQKESGYKYIKSKMVKKGGKPYMEVYLVKDPNQATFEDGGMMAKGGWIEKPMTGGRKKYVKENDDYKHEIFKKADGKYYVSTTILSSKSGVDKYSQTYESNISDDFNSLEEAKKYVSGMMAKGGKIKKLYAILVSPMGEMIADVEVTDTDERKAREKFREMGITQSGSIRFSNNQPHYYEQGGKTSSM